MRFYISTLFFIILFVQPAQSTFLPPDQIADLNDLPKGRANISEQEFNQLLDHLRAIYTPIVSAHGGKLSLDGQWKNETPNARATQMFGSWKVEITGGLARRPELSADGFVLIACHELGHHLGGYPMAGLLPVDLPINLPVGGMEPWAASEGQSDYFAAHVCAKEIWMEQTELNSQIAQSGTQEQKQYCDAVWSTEEEKNLCIRTLMGVESLITTMAVLSKKEIPQFSTPDTNVVNKTNSSHPEPQCRMDTGLQAALCLAPYTSTVIPGKKTAGGLNSKDAEQESLQFSCSQHNGYQLGIRPACWFKSVL